MTIDAISRRALLGLARQAVATAVGVTATPDAPGHTALPILHERRGAFVTLTRHQRLRGCIGRVEADAPLRSLVPEMARAAAVADPRFPRVRAHELAALRVEISLLSPLEPLAHPLRLEVGRHGLLASARGRRGLLLPQVALQYGWTREQLLSEACAKAGLPPDAWRGEGVGLHVFTAEVFAEGDE